MKKIIIIISIYMIIVISWFFLYRKYHLRQLDAMGYIFHSIWRDPTEIYSLSEEQYNQMTGFNIDDKAWYYNEQYMKFINNYIIDEYDRYSKRDEQILKKVKEDINYLETLKDTEYMFDYIKKDCPSCSDNKGCIYNPTKKKGYCIRQYM